MAQTKNITRSLCVKQQYSKALMVEQIINLFNLLEINNDVVCRITTLPGVAPPVHCIDLGQVAPESASRPHLYPAHGVQTSCDLAKHRKKHH